MDNSRSYLVKCRSTSHTTRYFRQSNNRNRLTCELDYLDYFRNIDPIFELSEKEKNTKVDLITTYHDLNRLHRDLSSELP